MATDCVHYAVGVRKRLQEDAKRARWSVCIPRYALVGAVQSLLGPGMRPAEHGRKPRVLCSACGKLRPATLHWSEACLKEKPETVGQEAARCCLSVMCRRCACRRGGGRVHSAETQKASPARASGSPDISHARLSR